MGFPNSLDSTQAISQSLLSNEWVIIGASVQGSRHIEENCPCQDAFGLRLVGADHVIIAVADGLGSASQSATGAHLAVSSAINQVELKLLQGAPGNQRDWLNLFKEIFEKVHSRLEEEAAGNQRAVHDYATTLILALISPGYLVIGHIGDGAVIALDPLGALSTVSGPQNGEYINDTFPITLPNAVDIARIQAIPSDLVGLALITDGLQLLSLHQSDHTPHSPFFNPLFSQLPAIESGAVAAAKLSDFLMSPRVNNLTGDDKTLVLARRKKVDPQGRE